MRAVSVPGLWGAYMSLCHMLWVGGVMCACCFAALSLVQALSPPGTELCPALIILSSASLLQPHREARPPRQGVGGLVLVKGWIGQGPIATSSWCPRKAKLGAASGGRPGMQRGWEGVQVGSSPVRGPSCFKVGPSGAMVVALGRWRYLKPGPSLAPPWCCP